MENEQVVVEPQKTDVKIAVPEIAGWAKWTAVILRILIGATFIFSGFVKVIDPWGTVYKFGEYFSVLGLDFLVSLITLFAFALAVLEFVLGVLLILGCYRRVTVWITLALMAFMLPLTLYLAITDNVADCGCFGEVIHLSNWMTFLKNVFIVAGLIFLCKYNRFVKNVYGFQTHWIIVLFSGIFAYVICFIGYIYQPLIDFRPFKIGNPLVEIDSHSEDSDNFVFIYKKGDVKKEFTVDNLPGDDWEYVDRVVVGDTPKVEDLENYLTVSGEDGEDITEDVIITDGDEIIFLFPNLGDIEISSTFAINEINDLAEKQGMKVVGLTSMSEENIETWKDLSMAAYPMYIIDDSVLKQIARGNPAIVYLSDGIIKWKRTLSSIPLDDLTQDTVKMEELDKPEDAKNNLILLISVYVVLMFMLYIVDRTYHLIKLKSSLNKENKNKNVTL